jgi:hypothetical protein
MVELCHDEPEGKMFMKSVVAAGLTALSFSLASAPAEAKPKIYLQFGDPGYNNCDYDRYGRLRCYNDRDYFVNPRPRPRPDYYDDENDYDRLSCNDATRLLREKGYRKVRAQDCDGRTYSFTARYQGRRVVVVVNSYTGAIRLRRPSYEY